MDNNIYNAESRATLPYIIVVKQFTGGVRTVPPANTYAYGYPTPGSRRVYTFPQPTASTYYNVNSLVYCSGIYWVVIPNLIVNSNEVVTGYVKCNDIGFNYTSYANPDNQTPNSAIGTNKEVIFNMWYLPTSVYKGVNCATPLYYQYYYINGKRENSGKCTLFASISGLYGAQGLTENPTTYMNSMTDKYWSNGITVWLAKMDRTTSQSTIRQKAKTNLDAHKPMIIGATNTTGNSKHMVLVAGYKNSGNNLSDYLVLDSCERNFSTLEKFFNSYPAYNDNWAIDGKGYVYGEF